MPARLLELVTPLHMARSWIEGKVVPSGTSSILPIFVFVAADPCQDHSFHSASSGKERCMSATSEDTLRVIPQCSYFVILGTRDEDVLPIVMVVCLGAVEGRGDLASLARMPASGLVHQKRRYSHDSAGNKK